MQTHSPLMQLFLGLKKLTFMEYLQTTDLTENLMQYVAMCIAMREYSVSALEVSFLKKAIFWPCESVTYNKGLQAARLFFKVSRTFR